MGIDKEEWREGKVNDGETERKVGGEGMDGRGRKGERKQGARVGTPVKIS